MKVDVSATGVIALAGVGVVGLVLWRLWASREAIGAAVNPASDKNIVYQGVNGIGASVSGDKDWSLGTWLYDITHPNEAEQLGLGAKRDHYEQSGRGASGSGAQESDDYSDPARWGFPI